MSEPSAGGYASRTGATWPLADLEARLVRALDLAMIVVQDFADAGYTDDVVPQLSFGPDKVIAETTILAYAAAGATANPVVTQKVAALADVLAPLCRSRRTLVDLAQRPARAFKYAVPHVLLNRLGRHNDDFDAFIARQCDMAQQMADDLPPCARLERHWIGQMWREDAARPSMPHLQGTVAEQPFDVLGASREDTYALTHILFYLSDFGRQPVPGLPRGRRAVLADVQACLARYLDAEDYDLCGELLMAWPQLRAPWDPVAAFCFRVLAGVEDFVGVLPCGNVDYTRSSSMAPAARQRYARATAYHTAYVMGFLCAVALRHGAPPLHAQISSPSPLVWPELLDLVNPGRGHWLPIFQELPVGEKPALTELVADTALVQAVAQRDYPRVGKALALADQGGVWGPLQSATAGRLVSLGVASGLSAPSSRSAAQDTVPRPRGEPAEIRSPTRVRPGIRSQ